MDVYKKQRYDAMSNVVGQIPDDALVMRRTKILAELQATTSNR